MLFSSVVFLYYFLPLAFILYAVVPGKLKNASLVLLSLLFYAWGEPKYVALMLATITIGYVFGLMIERCCIRGRYAKPIFALSVACVLAFLVYFKYADFLIGTINTVSGLSLPLPKIALPIGISFYSFQLISYLADVYRREEKAQRNFIDLAAYISFFPQLIAGPIVRYGDIALQLKTREHSFEKISLGFRRFVLGLSKKILLANLLAKLVAVYHASANQTVLFTWLYALAYTLQIYYDFSGYSDMAIGLGTLFGFSFPENFNYPFISGTITEFWRRWHMTLGSWFRDYVYIPLGGNRVGRLKQLRNILVIWGLTGLWHGAAWNFVSWGLYYGFWLLMEKYLLGKYLKKSTILRYFYTIVLTLIGFVIFDASSLQSISATILRMFSFVSGNLISPEFLYYLRSYAPLLVAAIIGSTPLPKQCVVRLMKTDPGSKLQTALESAGLIILLILCTSFLVDGSFNPFLYFRF